MKNVYDICPDCGGLQLCLDEGIGHAVCDTCDAEWRYGDRCDEPKLEVCVKPAKKETAVSSGFPLSFNHRHKALNQYPPLSGVYW